MDLADVPWLPGSKSWGSLGRLSMFGHLAGGRAGEPASRGRPWGGRPGRGIASHLGILPKPSEASTHLEGQACPISLPWELDVHRISDESRAGPNLGENGLQGK